MLAHHVVTPLRVHWCHMGLKGGLHMDPYHMGSHPIWGPYPYLEGVPRSGGGSPDLEGGPPKWEVLRSEDLQIHGFDLIFRGLDLF